MTKEQVKNQENPAMVAAIAEPVKSEDIENISIELTNILRGTHKESLDDRLAAANKLSTIIK